MRPRVVALFVGAVAVTVAAWLLRESLDEPGANDAPVIVKVPRSSTSAEEPALPVLVDAFTDPPLDPNVSREDNVTIRANGTLRIEVDAPGRATGGTDELYLLIDNDVVQLPRTLVVVKSLSAMEHSVRLGSPTHLEPETKVLVRPNETVLHRIHLDLPTTGGLRVTTVDKNGTPMGAQLAIAGTATLDRLFTSGDNGMGGINLPLGDYTVSHRRSSVRVQIVAGRTRDLTLTITPMALVRGLVFGSDGRPLSRARVSVTNGLRSRARS